MESIKAGIRTRAQDNQLLMLKLTVLRVHSVSPGFTRVELEGPGLAEYRDPRPADAFKIVVPQSIAGHSDAAQPVLRAFTVRHFDPGAQRLSMDVAAHGSGLSIDWLNSVRPGDTVDLTGMRPEWAVGADVRDHVLIGDPTALPAIASIVESLDPGDTVAVHLTLADRADADLLPAHPKLSLHIHDTLTDVVHHTPEPIAANRRTQVWIAAEAAPVRTIRAHALSAWHVDRADLLARAYWKQGRTSTDNDAEGLIAYQKAMADGADLHDPELAESIDLAP